MLRRQRQMCIRDRTKKLTVKAEKFTASAKEKIEALGGKAEVI